VTTVGKLYKQKMNFVRLSELGVWGASSEIVSDTPSVDNGRCSVQSGGEI
jgi:hypothetical protein